MVLPHIGRTSFDLNMERAPSVSRVVPFPFPENTSDHNINIYSNSSSSKDGHDEHEHDSGPEQGPDDWLPITQCRKGNSFSAAVNLMSVGLGIQSILAPLAFVPLGWAGGTVCLCLLFAWHLYTAWLLVHLHQPSNTTTGPRYSRYLVLAVIAFGPRLGKWLAIFPVLYLSGASCSLLVITGGGILELFLKLVCPDRKPLTGAECFLVFICTAILVSQFFPTLHSLTPVSLLGSLSALIYFSLLWTVSINRGKVHPSQQQKQLQMRDPNDARRIINAIGVIALTFRGHNVVLEIQGTLPSTDVPPRRPMMRGVAALYSFISFCVFPLAMGGYWAYGDHLMLHGKVHGIVDAFAEFHHASKGIIGTIYVAILVHWVCQFQVYAMPTWDNWERLMYVGRKNGACPRWVRCGIRVLFGGLSYFIACAFPFLLSLGPFMGALTLPLSLAYPCFMWVAVRKPRRWSTPWCLNMGLGCLGMALSLLLASVALWTLIRFGLDANFFHPH